MSSAFYEYNINRKLKNAKEFLHLMGYKQHSSSTSNLVLGNVSSENLLSDLTDIVTLHSDLEAVDKILDRILNFGSHTLSGHQILFVHVLQARQFGPPSIKDCMEFIMTGGASVHPVSTSQYVSQTNVTNTTSSNQYQDRQYTGSNQYQYPPVTGSNQYQYPPVTGSNQYQYPPVTGSNQYQYPAVTGSNQFYQNSETRVPRNPSYSTHSDISLVYNDGSIPGHTHTHSQYAIRRNDRPATPKKGLARTVPTPLSISSPPPGTESTYTITSPPDVNNLPAPVMTQSQLQRMMGRIRENIPLNLEDSFDDYEYTSLPSRGSFGNNRRCSSTSDTSSQDRELHRQMYKPFGSTKPVSFNISDDESEMTPDSQMRSPPLPRQDKPKAASRRNMPRGHSVDSSLDMMSPSGTTSPPHSYISRGGESNTKGDYGIHGNNHDSQYAQYGTSGNQHPISTQYGTNGSQYPISTQYGTSGSQYPISTQYGTNGSKYPISTQYGTSGSQYPISTQYGTSGSQYPTGTQYGTSGSQYPISTQYGTSGSQYPTGTQYGTSGSQYPIRTQYGTNGSQYPTSTQYGTSGNQYPISTQYGTNGSQYPITSGNQYHEHRSYVNYDVQSSMSRQSSDTALTNQSQKRPIPSPRLLKNTQSSNKHFSKNLDTYNVPPLTNVPPSTSSTWGGEDKRQMIRQMSRERESYVTSDSPSLQSRYTSSGAAARQPNKWRCDICGTLNNKNPNYPACVVCNEMATWVESTTYQPKVNENTSTVNNSRKIETDFFSTNRKHWECSYCMSLNYDFDNPRCSICQAIPKWETQ